MDYRNHNNAPCREVLPLILSKSIVRTIVRAEPLSHGVGRLLNQAARRAVHPPRPAARSPRQTPDPDRIQHTPGAPDTTYTRLASDRARRAAHPLRRAAPGRAMRHAKTAPCCARDTSSSRKPAFEMGGRRGDPHSAEHLNEPPDRAGSDDAVAQPLR